MKKILLFSILVLTLTVCSYARAGQKTLESTGDLQGEPVQVSGGSYRNILSEQLWVMLQKKEFVLINVHIPYEGELPNTDLFIPYNEIEKYSDKLPSDKTVKIVLYCRSGRMSLIASETLVRLGYTNIWNLNEGMNEWKKKGFPLLNKSKDWKPHHMQENK